MNDVRLLFRDSRDMCSNKGLRILIINLFMVKVRKNKNCKR